jgi:hypothetical protein
MPTHDQKRLKHSGKASQQNEETQTCDPLLFGVDDEQSDTESVLTIYLDWADDAVIGAEKVSPNCFLVESLN